MVAQLAAADPASASLPLLTLYLTDRCNSRCVTCDYWRHGRTNLTLATVSRLAPSLAALRTRLVLLSGGEPLLNPEWAEIAARLRAQGLKLWLLTSGLSLAKHAARASALFESITVSLDGTTPETYAAIRGLNAFEVVCDGIRAAAAAGVPVSIRVTVQRANYRELPRFVSLARELGARQVSFLAVDVSNPHAFGRLDDFSSGLALAAADLDELAHILETLEHEHADAFRGRFIAESPAKLARILQYFRALQGRAEFPPVRCNAPEFSAVLDAGGRLQPCFFIPAPPGAATGEDLQQLLIDPLQVSLRASIRAGERTQCRRCVCSMWRDPGDLGSAERLLPRVGTG